MKFILYTIIAQLIFIFSAQAQTAETVIDDYFKAIGGREAWRNVKSIINVGRTELMLKNAPNRNPDLDGKTLVQQSIFINYMQYPLQYRLDVTDEGGWNISSQSKDQLWTKIKDGGIQNSSVIESHSLVYKVDMADFVFANAFVFLDYKSKGHTVEYGGAEVLDNINYNVLKVVIKSDGRDFYYYFNASTKLLERKLGEKSKIESQTLFGDYRSVNQLLFPFTQKNYMKGSHLISNTEYIEINSPIIKDELFDLYSETNSFTNESVRRMILLSKLKED